jgi:RHS repeat-associated protein
VRETSSAGTSKQYAEGPGIDRPYGFVDGNSVASFYVADHLGSIAQTTNSSGSTNATPRTYDPYGGLQTGGSNGGFAFTGREWDAETNLYYYRARYYDPTIGRFLSEDPAGWSASPNLYVYVANHPLVARDPSGLRLLKCARRAQGLLATTSHVYVCDPDTNKNCGEGAKDFRASGNFCDYTPYPQTDEPVCQSGPGVVCVPIPESEKPNNERDFFDCCMNPPPSLPCRPDNSCHEYADN